MSVIICGRLAALKNGQLELELLAGGDRVYEHMSIGRLWDICDAAYDDRYGVNSTPTPHTITGLSAPQDFMPEKKPPKHYPFRSLNAASHTPSNRAPSPSVMPGSVIAQVWVNVTRGSGPARQRQARLAEELLGRVVEVTAEPKWHGRKKGDGSADLALHFAYVTMKTVEAIQ